MPYLASLIPQFFSNATYIDILSALCTNGRKDLIVSDIESVDALCFLIALPSAQIGCAG